MATDLYVKQAGDGPAVVLLHGLFGASANLGALARALQATYSVFSVDLPGHGRSAWIANPTLPAMAERLRLWLEEAGLSRAHFVGHSLGGKVAMELALQQPGRVSSLAVADIAPVAYQAHHNAVFAALEAVATRPCTSREEAGARMAQHLGEDSVIQFLLSSLQRDAQGYYHWRFDLSGLRAAYPALLAAPAGGRTYAGPVLFIKGCASEYIQPQFWPVVQQLFPAATLEVMPGCGHWLHAEKPVLFNSIVTQFLVSLEQRQSDAPDNNLQEN
jgi:esterase